MGKVVSIEGRDYLNLATSNFLGFVGDSRIEVWKTNKLKLFRAGGC